MKFSALAVLALAAASLPAFASSSNDQPQHHVYFRPWRTYDHPAPRPTKPNYTNPNSAATPDQMIYYPTTAPVLDADGNSAPTTFFCYTGQANPAYDSKPYFMHLTYDNSDGFVTTCNSDSFWLLYTLEKVLNPGIPSDTSN